VTDAARFEVPGAGAGQAPPLPPACPGCGEPSRPEVLRLQSFVCGCGHHYRLPALTWAALLADPGSWRERWAELAGRDWLGWPAPKPYADTLEDARRRGLNEAVRTGSCQVGGWPVELSIFDFGFVGGSLGVVAGERLALAMERAVRLRHAHVLVASSGGARMQEGVLALMQMVKVNAAVTELHEGGVPYFSILTDPTFGGTAASLALLGDVNIAEHGVAIGFTGPRVIQQATHCRLPDGFQSAEFQLHHGQVDMVVDRRRLRALLTELLALYC
jgi:acetyl-CoA carboxylase carboxyl transferase beta subunit